MSRASLIVLLIGSAACSHSPGGRRVSAAEFASQALKTLPAEEPFAFHKALSEGKPALRRDPDARTSAAEVSIPFQGWTLVIRSDAGPVLRVATEDFRDHLKSAMQTSLELFPEAIAQ